jgi:hypothetical protein
MNGSALPLQGGSPAKAGRPSIPSHAIALLEGAQTCIAVPSRAAERSRERGFASTFLKRR